MRSPIWNRKWASLYEESITGRPRSRVWTRLCFLADLVMAMRFDVERSLDLHQ